MRTPLYIYLENSAPPSEVQSLKFDLEYNNGTMTKLPKNIHVTANTLKLWLKEIRSPVIPPEIYYEMIGKCNDFNALKILLTEKIPGT